MESFALCLNSLAALPGPYIEAFLGKIGPEGLHKMLVSFDDKGAVAQHRVAFCAGSDQNPKVWFVGVEGGGGCVRRCSGQGRALGSPLRTENN